MKKNNTICILDDDINFAYALKNSINISNKELCLNFDILVNACPIKKSNYLNLNFYFLDIEMPNLTGYQVAEMIIKHEPKAIILFISTHEKYVFDSFQFRPYSFLRKETCFEELPKLFSRIKKDFFSVYEFSYYDEKIILPICEIIYIVKYINHIEITTSKALFKQNTTIKDIKQKLWYTTNDFIQVNSSTLLNINYLSKVNGKCLELSNTHKLYASKNYTKLIKEQFLVHNFFK